MKTVAICILAINIMFILCVWYITKTRNFKVDIFKNGKWENIGIFESHADANEALDKYGQSFDNCKITTIKKK